ncbi:MAG: DUF1540 domain-containing protein [Oscillospiraceae bacterium]
MEDRKNGQSIIREVHCDATNCKHNDNNCKCTANHIDVGTRNSVTSSETKCKTFECDNLK